MIELYIHKEKRGGMMSQYEYEKVELPFIEQLQEYGYKHYTGKMLEAERDSQSSIILEDRFRAALKRLNPWMSEGNLDKLVRQFVAPTGDGLWSINNKVYNWLFGDGVTVEQDLGSGKKGQTVKFFDIDNPTSELNEYLVVNQLSITNPNGTIRPDILLYINGLPLVIIECKSPKLQPEKQLPECVHQMERYVETNEKLFYYNQLMIATSRDRAKVGTLYAKAQHYGLWIDPYPMHPDAVGSTLPQDILIAGILRKEVLLNLLNNYIVYDGPVKKFARYQQYRAVEKAIERILNNDRPALRGGVVWHTQGSGKSLTMVYLGKKLRRIKDLENPMIVIVTDREDLDNQITETFTACGFPNPTQATSVKDLKQQLSKGPGATVMTLIHKFQAKEDEDFPIISEAENIIVMTDESHRSQYKGLAMNMRRALPNATFIGFTGTPIDKEKRSTTGKFGSYIDKYTIDQAVADGATVPIFYESRLPHLQMKGETLDELFARSFSEFDDDAKERIKAKFVNKELILTAPDRMRDIALDIVKHFEEKILVNGYKAQVVAVSRRAAAQYKELIDKFANGKFETAVIFSEGQNDTDELLKKYKTSKDDEKTFIKRFKKPFHEDKLAMLIVCDKLLTGFDAPIEQVMYLDKPLKEHNLLQAIARTNRRYDGHKTYGLIVDYFGVSRFLDEALDIFSANDVKGALQSIDNELPRLEQRHRAAMRFFDGLKHSQEEQAVLRLKPEDLRAKFDIAYKRFAESMDRVLPDPKAQRFLKDFKWVSLIRQRVRSTYAIHDGMDIDGCGEKVRQIVHDYISSQGIEVRKPIPILDEKFKEEIDNQVLPESKAAQIEHAVKREISVSMEKDEVFYQSLKEKVESLIQQLRDEQLTIFEYIDEMMKVREDLVKKASGETTSGLTAYQEPFYNKLVEVCESKEDYELKEIAVTIQQYIEETVTPIPDWKKKTDFKRNLNGQLIRHLLDQKLSVAEAGMLTGYFVALAEKQY
ncbi:type I restriction enzyme R subunit [Ureibacillus xyleni]|uniref:Type I restriction enzyme endonuclease subunit n=2 Tax=Ureibacillus xyleni TaxID=614648 RepID=A0A285TI90_9BACL|nr:type I restriction enzyme R subunit [Ureibacillus xyleni]